MQNFKNILYKIKDLGKENCFEYFGDFGIDFYNFSKVTDLDHPDLTSPFSKSDLEFLENYTNEVYKIKNKKILSFFSDTISKNFKKYNLNKLKQTRFYLYDERQKSRLNKKKFKFKSKNFHKIAQQYWHSTPCDFGMFRRHSKKYLEEQKKIEEISKNFYDLGFSLIGEELEKTSCFLKSEFDSYFGFKRITITNCLLIIAKLKKLEFCKINNQNLFLKKNKKEIKIFEPIVSPITDINNKILELEHIQELNNKPAFDHYLELFSGYDEDKENPAILGEKDGLCYFLYYN